MRFTKMMLLATMVAMFGCGDDGNDNNNDSTVDGGNTQGTDSNTSTSTDTTSQVLTGPCVLTTADGDDYWVGRETNSCGAQGSWFTYRDADNAEKRPDGTGSTIELYRNGAAVCAKGNAMQADPPDYTLWGAGIGLNLCDDGGALPISTCVNSPKLASMIGFRLSVTGVAGSAFRVTMGQADREENCFITANEADITNGATVDYLFADATVEYSPSDPLVDATQVRALQLQVASSETADVPFDFCVQSVQILFADDIATGTDTDTDTDTGTGM